MHQSPVSSRAVGLTLGSQPVLYTGGSSTLLAIIIIIIINLILSNPKSKQYFSTLIYIVNLIIKQLDKTYILLYSYTKYTLILFLLIYNQLYTSYLRPSFTRNITILYIVLIALSKSINYPFLVLLDFQIERSQLRVKYYQGQDQSTNIGLLN